MKCEYCKSTRENRCRDKSPEDAMGSGGYICMRVKGHSGDHVACGIVDHMIMCWSTKEEQENHVKQEKTK